MTTLHRRLAGLAATLAIGVFIVGMPAVLLWAQPYLWNLSWGELQTRAMMPDDGTLLMAGTLAIAWLAWAYLAWGILLEAAYRIRGMRAPRLHGFALSQGAARRLVDVAALLFVAAPTLAPLAPAPAHAAVAVATAQPPAPATQPTEPPPPAPQTSAAPQPAEEATPAPAAEPATVEYTVKRGDSLWKIAERHLGHGRDWTTIRDLNTAVLGDDPGFITPGVVLRIPQPTPPARDDASEETYVVKKGDTLSQIAADEVGDAARYPEIFEASKDIDQPGGEHLTDPDLIKPGWTLDVTPDDADATETAAGVETEPAPPSPTPSTGPRGADKAPTETGEGSTPSSDHPGLTFAGSTPSVAPSTAPDSVARAAEESPTDDADTAALSWLLPGLTGAGALLAGSLWLTIRARRATAARFRQTGMMLPPLPAELQPVATTARAAGRSSAETISSVTPMLQSLAPDPALAPKVVRAELTTTQVTLHLAEPADLPAPWTGRGLTWIAPVAAPADAAEGESPYPLLVPLGRDSEGSMQLVNLEHLGALALRGDADRVAGFARHLASQVALNPWSASVRVHAVGALDELADIDRLRLRHYAADDPAGIAQIAAAVGVDGALAYAPDQYFLLIAAQATEPVTDLAAVIAAHPTRPGAAVVVLEGEAPQMVEAELTEDGRLVIAGHGIDVEAPGLTSEEATAVARVVAASDEVTSVPIPADDEATDGWRARSNLAGALRPELVGDRPLNPDELAPNSVLPKPAAEYAAVAPVTVDDVAVLAPPVDGEAATQVEDDFPNLDADLAEFNNPSSARPKLRLLGPITAHTSGNRVAVVYRERKLVEAFAYLMLHPNGVTASELVEAGVTTEARAHKTMNELRTWLGANPTTGHGYLPDSRTSPAARTAGSPRYQLEGALCDVDLFCALRARGQARGEDGIPDLVTALKLVTGVPFTWPHEEGFAWLFEGERTDHIMALAILETASTVIAHGLHARDLELARMAAESAHRAAPDDIQARLDLIAVAAAEGHGDLAEAQLRDDIVDHSDDYRSPVELSERTQAIVNALTRATRQRRT